METDPSNQADDTEPQEAEHAPENVPQDVAGERVEPAELPETEPVEQPPEDETPLEAAPAADVVSVDNPQPDVPAGLPLELPPGVELPPTDIRHLADQLRPRGEFELPLPDDAETDDDDITMDEAIGHFVSPAEDRKRELNIGQEHPAARASRPAATPTRGDAEIAIQRPGRGRSAAGVEQTGDANSGDSGSQGPRINLPPPPISPAGTRQGEALSPAPQLHVIVQMADARATYDEAIDEALDRKAPEYREIAKSEVKMGFWRYGNERRRTDYRLRGPG